MTRRYQLSRAKGWRLPSNTVSVTRPGPHGNPVRVHRNCPPPRPHAVVYPCRPDNAAAVAHYRLALRMGWYGLDAGWVRRELVDRNLACWCKLCDDHADGKPADVECSACEPCHADVLLIVAAGGQP